MTPADLVLALTSYMGVLVQIWFGIAAIVLVALILRDKLGEVLGEEGERGL